MFLRTVLTSCVALVVAGCGLENRYDAAESVHRFFTAVQEGDVDTFNESIDRDAVRASLRAGLMRARSGAEGELIERMLAGQRSNEMLDRMISPESFRLVTQGAGGESTRVPTTIELAAALKTLDENRVCLPDGNSPDRCALTFERQGEDWKLVSVSTAGMQVRPLPAGRS